MIGKSLKSSSSACIWNVGRFNHAYCEREVSYKYKYTITCMAKTDRSLDTISLNCSSGQVDSITRDIKTETCSTEVHGTYLVLLMLPHAYRHTHCPASD